MICYECVLKHLSAALSYGKEIMSGHGKGAELDHRPDYLGQIVNVEHHLELIDQQLFEEVSAYRKQLQAKRIDVDQDDLAFIRKIYNIVQLKEEGVNTVMTSQTNSMLFDTNPDIIYINVQNKTQFLFSYQLLKKNLTNYNNVYILNPNIDLSDINDVQIINETWQDFIIRQNLTQNFIIMYENTSFLKTVDARAIPTTFALNIKNNKQIFPELRQYHITGKIQLFDYIKAQPINKTKFKEIMADYNGKYPVSIYNLLLKNKNIISNNFITVNVERPVCCSTKSALKIKSFVNWNNEAFQSLVDFLNK